MGGQIGGAENYNFFIYSVELGVRKEIIYKALSSYL